MSVIGPIAIGAIAALGLTGIILASVPTPTASEKDVPSAVKRVAAYLIDRSSDDGMINAADLPDLVIEFIQNEKKSKQ